MSELTDLALAAITQSQRRVEIVGQNVANATTPAFKRRVAFTQLLRNENVETRAVPQTSVAIDARQGKIVKTDSPTDLALNESGYFELRRGTEVIYSRNGQLTVNADGQLINDRGFVLQLVNGADLVVENGAFDVSATGSVVQNGKVIGQIGVWNNADTQSDIGGEQPGAAQLVPVETSGIVQGAYEASNVVTGDEMVAMVEALRRAESGQRLMNVYDDLMGRVITAFGEGAR